RDTNFFNEENWAGGKLPCPANKIVFPASAPAVYFDQDMTLREMVFPSDGLFVFERDLSISFLSYPTNDDSCPEGDVHFAQVQPKHWYDPDNWCIPLHDFDAQCLDVDLLSEKVPCRNDDVIFPSDKTFYVSLDTDVEISIRSLRIGYTVYDTEQFKQFLTSDLGKKQFVLASSANDVTIHRGYCNNATGCPCGNDRGAILNKVCSFQRSRCGSTPCTSPFTPVGHCCSLCGALLLMTYNVNFELVKIRRTALDKVASEAEFSGVKVIVSKRYDDKIQMVVTDSNGGINAIKLASWFKDLMGRTQPRGSGGSGEIQERAQGRFNENRRNQRPFQARLDTA
ncbi:LOW QUALITY PROTEIN: protein amnionless-like, partial [Lingula anatina]|uniref:Protein amnionless n=1 Tax=Lingula anatina TaxID=7574 RepID=A0A1S3I722_LINAN